MSYKVCLVKPPESSSFNFGTYSLGVLAAAIRDTCQVVIVDASDLSIPETVERVTRCAADLVGVTVMGLPSVQPAKEFVGALRNGRYRNRIVAGGHGATMTPGPMLAAGADAVVMGEGELALQSIIEYGIIPGAAGLACMAGGEVICGPPGKLVHPLDTLKSAARDLMPPPADGVHLMETSRGCPHACSFCETTRFYGRRWRPFSPGRVAEEAGSLIMQYDAYIIQFADDNFAADPGRVLEICERLNKGPLPAFFMLSARADDLLADPRIIPAMASARILRITVGVESVEPGMNDVTGKNISRETYRELFRVLGENGIFSVASFILGLPGETKSYRENAVCQAIDLGCDSSHFLPFLPFPGIPLATCGTYEPAIENVRDARLLSREFLVHHTTQKRLLEACGNNDVRGRLARATLEKSMREIRTIQDGGDK